MNKPILYSHVRNLIGIIFIGYLVWLFGGYFLEGVYERGYGKGYNDGSATAFNEAIGYFKTNGMTATTTNSYLGCNPRNDTCRMVGE